jgi:hypothetical protein
MYTLQEKSDTHDTYASYASPHMSSYVATFHEVINRVEQIHCSWERGLPTTSPACWLTDPWVPTQFLFPQPLKPWGKSQASVDDKLHRFTRPILQHVISTFNTCSRIPTSRSLTDTDGGYNLGGAGFQHHSPYPSQPTVLRFPLRVPPSLRLTILNMKPPKSK